MVSGEGGVIDMALLSVIRRWAVREGMPIREISRRTGLSRNTIRKYLRAGATEPRFRLPDRPSKLDPFAGSCRAGCAVRPASRASSGARRSRCTPTSTRWATTAPATAPSLRRACGLVRHDEGGWRCVLPAEGPYFNPALSSFSALAGITSTFGWSFLSASRKSLASPTTTMLAGAGSRSFAAADCTAAGSAAVTEPI